MTNQEKANRKRLRSRLESLLGYLDRYYSINYGGCCWVTYCLAVNLERLNIHFDLVVYDDDYEYSEEEVYDNIKCRLESFPTGVDTTAGHFTLRVTGMGILNKVHGYSSCLTVHNIDSEDIHWIYQSGDWNNCYNYRLNNDIKNLIDSTFSIYEEETRKDAA